MNVSWDIPLVFFRLKTEDIILLRTEPLSDILEGDPVMISAKVTAGRDPTITVTRSGPEQSPPHSVAPDTFSPSTPPHSRQSQEPI
jgi:hypothetical protein